MIMLGDSLKYGSGNILSLFKPLPLFQLKSSNFLKLSKARFWIVLINYAKTFSNQGKFRSIEYGVSRPHGFSVNLYLILIN